MHGDHPPEIWQSGRMDAASSSEPTTKPTVFHKRKVLRPPLLCFDLKKRWGEKEGEECQR